MYIVLHDDKGTEVGVNPASIACQTRRIKSQGWHLLLHEGIELHVVESPSDVQALIEEQVRLYADPGDYEAEYDPDDDEAEEGGGYY